MERPEKPKPKIKRMCIIFCVNRRGNTICGCDLFFARERGTWVPSANPVSQIFKLGFRERESGFARSQITLQSVPSLVYQPWTRLHFHTLKFFSSNTYQTVTKTKQRLGERERELLLPASHHYHFPRSNRTRSVSVN